MAKISGIYCIENLIDGKKYIGQTNDMARRKQEHLSHLKCGTHNNQHLQSAWNIYGKDNFVLYVIEECSLEVIDAREQYYIATFQTANENFGYNIEPGGHITKVMSDETRQKISASLKGRSFSDEHREKIGKANSERVVSEETRQKMRDNHADVSGENNPFYGRCHTEESKQKMRQNHSTLSGEQHPLYGRQFSEESKEKMRKAKIGKMQGENHPRSRAIYCFELNEYFWGAAEAEQKYGIRRSDITAHLSGRQKSAGKHPDTGDKLHWCYSDSLQS
jgi:group I intron endonuclease